MHLALSPVLPPEHFALQWIRLSLHRSLHSPACSWEGGVGVCAVGATAQTNAMAMTDLITVISCRAGR